MRTNPSAASRAPSPPARRSPRSGASEASASIGWSPSGPNTLREMLGPDLAEHDVAIGDRQRAAAPVAGRAGHRAGAVRPDPEALPVIGADRAAARRDGVDLQHRRAHPDPGDGPLAGPLVGAGEMRDVGRGAAHVEADDLVEARLGRGPRHADDAAGGAGQDRVLAAKGGGIGQAAVRLHEEQPALSAAAAPRRPGRRSGAAPATDRRRPPRCRRGRSA